MRMQKVEGQNSPAARQVPAPSSASRRVLRRPRSDGARDDGGYARTCRAPGSGVVSWERVQFSEVSRQRQREREKGNERRGGYPFSIGELANEKKRRPFCLKKTCPEQQQQRLFKPGIRTALERRERLRPALPAASRNGSFVLCVGSNLGHYSVATSSYLPLRRGAGKKIPSSAAQHASSSNAPASAPSGAARMRGR